MSDKNKKNIKGLGGWLLFFTIFYAIGFLISIYLIYRLLFSFNSIDTFSKILAILYILGEFLILNSLILIIQEAKIAPKWAIIAVWFYAIPSILRRDIEVSIYLIVLAIIWTLYFKKAPRVKNTFKKDVGFKI